MSCDDLSIVRYHLASGRCYFYGPADGMQNMEFNTTASYLSKNGVIYFGGSGGIVSFIPSEIKSNPVYARPVITNISIRNMLVSPGDSLNGRVLLDKQVWETNKIRLYHNESELTIEFSALHFSAPEKIIYQYKLEGFNSNWVYTDSKRRFASYTGLPPGEYTFYLKATNNDGLMCRPEDEVHLQITIVPPFWKTLWFKILVIFLIVAVGLLYVWLRLRSLQNKNILLNNKVKERTLELEEANNELDQHRNKLEFLVEERTRELETALLIAEESSRLKTSFLTNMSHEIRTPMNAIIGFSSLLKDKELHDEHDEYINIITSSGFTLLTLINDILDLSSLQSQQVSLNPENSNLKNLLKKIYETHQIEIKKKKLELKLNTDLLKEDFYMVFDEIRLTQVLSNLISNARKFTHQGFIEFGVYDISQKITFYVKDTGIGISKDTGDAIFERFYKIEKDNKELFRGAGLGLAICKNIVSLWNGEIWYESEADKGSTFFFSHPLNIEGRTHAEPAEESEIKHLDLKGKKILISEDDESNFKLLQNYLRNTHAEILWAKNGLEAIKLTCENPVDIILMDIKMPKMSGIEASRKIREQYPHIPIIAQTAYAFKNEVEGFLKSGICDYLIKPIHKYKLFELMKKHLKMEED
jgi:signal transduction histidine kinase/ActR/RegA family two-component response regulator